MAKLNSALKAAVLGLKPEQKKALRNLLSEGDAPIAVIGMSGRFPGRAQSINDFWKNLEDKVDCISEIPSERFNIDELYDPNPATPGKLATRWGGFMDEVKSFDADFFGVSPRESKWMDPQQRLLLQVTWEALEDSGYAGITSTKSNTGVFIGASAVEYGMLSRPVEQIDGYSSTGLANSIISNRLSYQFNLRGPSMTIDTACSSSLVAAHTGCQSLRRGECSMAIVGGVNVLVSPVPTIAFTKWGMMAADGRSKSFDHRADGFVRGEGCGVLVLKRLEDAEADQDQIYAVIRGSAVNQDGRSAGLTAPNVDAQVDVLMAAHRSAQVEPDDISYVEAHGTGTALGDPIEVEALSEVFRTSQTPCALGAVKSNIGHLEAAAGIAGVIKVICSLRNKAIPGNLHFEKINPHIELENSPFYIPTEKTDWSPNKARMAGVSSFGFGGTNAHLIIQETPSQRSLEKNQTDRSVLLLSANSEKSLRNQAKSHRAFLEADPSINSYDVFANAALGRVHHKHRLAVLAKNSSQAVERLSTYLAGETSKHIITSAETSDQRSKLALVFSGQGSVWTGMGNDLVANPEFQTLLEQCELGFSKKKREVTLKEILTSKDESLLNRTDYAQWAIFVIQVFLFTELKKFGIQPFAIIGHSVGEIAAAYCSGMLDLDAAFNIINIRGELMYKHHGDGRMFEVNVPAADIKDKANEKGLSVAVINSHDSVVLSGETTIASSAYDEFESEGYTCRWLKVDYAFHGPEMRKDKTQLKESLGNLSLRHPKVPYYSAVTGLKIDAAIDGAEYFSRNMAEPVRFATAMSTLKEDGANVYIEIAPHPILLRSIVKPSAQEAESSVCLPTMRRGREFLVSWLSLLSSLYANNVDLNWSLHFDKGYTKLSLPLYSWDTKNYWNVESVLPKPQIPSDYPTVVKKVLAPGLDHDTFELNFSPPFVLDHVMNGRAIVPFTFYIDLAAYILGRSGRTTFSLSNLTVLEPVFVEKGVASNGTLQVETVDGLERLTCFSYSKEADLPWRKNFRCDIHELKSGKDDVLLDSILDGYDEIRPGEEYYEFISGRGAEFGERFLGIKNYRKGTGKILARLEMPSLTSKEFKSFVFHPAFMDCGLHMVLGALGEGELPAEGAFLPVVVERVDMISAPSSEIMVELKIQEVDEAKVIADIEFYNFDEAKQTLAPCLAFHRIRFNYAAVDTHEVEAKRLLRQHSYRRQWVEQSLSVTSDLQGSKWLLVTSNEETGKNLQPGFDNAGAELYIVTTPSQSTEESSWYKDVEHILEQKNEISGVLFEPLKSTIFSDEIESWNAMQEMSRKALQLTRLATIIANQKRRCRLIVFDQSIMPQAESTSRFTFSGYSQLCSVIDNECPQISTKILGLEPSGDGIEYVIPELGASEPIVRWRGKSREVLRLERLGLGMSASEPVSAEKVHIIIGGFGYLGQVCAQWLTLRGSHKIVLLGRNPKDDLQWITELRSRNVQLDSIAVDVANRVELEKALEPYKKNIGGIIHAAGVLADQSFESLNLAAFEKVAQSKVAGAWNIHLATKNESLDFFYLFSSLATVVGSMHQGNYSVANGFLEELACYRAKNALPANAFALGPFDDGGMAYQLGESAKSLAKSVGIDYLSAPATVSALTSLAAIEDSVSVLAKVDWDVYRKRMSENQSVVLSQVSKSNESSASRKEAQKIISKLRKLPKAKQKPALYSEISRQLCAVLGFDEDEPIDFERGLFELGVDSMTALELTSKIEALAGEELSTTFVFELGSVGGIAEFLYSKIFKEEEERQETPQTDETLDDKSEDEILEMLMNELD